MLVLVKHPRDWIDRLRRDQQAALNSFILVKAQQLQLKAGELVQHWRPDWALLRVTKGVLELQINKHRLLVLEPGDFWPAHPGSVFNWQQEGAISLEVWPWQQDDLQANLALIGFFNNAIVALLLHNTQLPPDPMPGFEFFKAGEEIIREGEEADFVYTLIEGRAAVTVQGKPVGIAQENEILGLQAMLLKTTRTASVIAETPCSAVKVTYDKFQSLIETRPELVMATLETMARQIDRANKRMTTDIAD